MAELPEVVGMLSPRLIADGAAEVTLVDDGRRGSSEGHSSCHTSSSLKERASGNEDSSQKLDPRDELERRVANRGEKYPEGAVDRSVSSEAIRP